MYPAAEINGGTAPGYSSGQGISMMEDICGPGTPVTMGYEWTELALQQKLAGNYGHLCLHSGQHLRFSRAVGPV